MIKRGLLSCLLLFVSFFAKAQETPAPQMADAFRDNGKIYVVITVIALIFAAIVGFLLYLERRLKQLENKVQNFKDEH